MPITAVSNTTTCAQCRQNVELEKAPFWKDKELSGVTFPATFSHPTSIVLHEKCVKPYMNNEDPNNLVSKVNNLVSKVNNLVSKVKSAVLAYISSLGRK